MSRNVAPKIRAGGGKFSVPRVRSGVLLNRFGGVSVFQLHLSLPRGEAEAGNDKASQQKEFSQDGADSGELWLAIQLTFDPHLWSELSGQREEDEGRLEQVSNGNQACFW